MPTNEEIVDRIIQEGLEALRLYGTAATDTVVTEPYINPMGFGYLGLQLCESCYRPNHVFVSSTMREKCLKCFDAYDNLEGVRIPNSETYPILDEQLNRCEVCELPEYSADPNWVLRPAHLGDGTPVQAHRTCSRATCDKCSVIYANGNQRYWRGTYSLTHHQLNANIIIEGEHHCEQCAKQFWEENSDSDYFECECCESYTHYDNSAWWNSTRYCEPCVESNVYHCDDCGEQRWDGDDHYCEDDDDDESLIHNYSYRPSPFFFGTGKYHFGFELEVEARGNGRFQGALTVQNALGGHAYLKEDGSLSDGFEIVTHPHTLDKYHNDFNWGVLDKLKNDGYRSWNTSSCGLHVHVSRTAFGNGDPWAYGVPSSQRSQLILQRQSHELRFMKLVYDNQRQVERIAGRSGNQYATFQDKGKLLRKIKNGYQESGRYSAINTENDDTIEVRVFKGSLRKERVLSAIEFVHASVEYTRDMKVTSKNHALSWLKFTGYVASNAELYPNLVTIMSESFASDNNPEDN